MASEKEEKPIQVPITRNVINAGTFMRIPIRNWVEGVLFFIVVKSVLSLINFTSWAGTVFTFVYGGFAFLFGVKGIQNRSVTQYIYAKFKFNQKRRKLHLRGPQYVKKVSELKSMEGNNSYGEEILTSVKQRLLEFARNNSQE